jgi:hypothetical protein
LSLTVQELQDELFDNVLVKNATTAMLKEYGSVRGIDGGPTIVIPIEFAENGSYHRYSGSETLNTTSNQVFTSYSAAWCQVALNIQANGREILQNMGSSQNRDLIKSRVMSAKHSFENNFNEDLLSDGSAANQITGLQAHIADAGTGTVQGVARSAYDFAKNQFYRATTDGNAALTATNIVGYMDALDILIQARRGNTKLILADNATYKLYESAVHPLQRVTDPSGALARLGFKTYKYKQAEVVLEPTVAGMPASTMYFLDPEVIELIHHSSRNLVRLPKRESWAQDAQIEYLAWMGNLCVKNYLRLGVLNND